MNLLFLQRLDSSNRRTGMLTVPHAPPFRSMLTRPKVQGCFEANVTVLLLTDQPFKFQNLVQFSEKFTIGVAWRVFVWHEL